ncbi:chromatin assembly factor 1 subunit C [Dacryopinax primogenitus]|uniref:Chromatin assembly factor 1 subunit C n=1 Tax=Dacryopinax primogenitus (strain DJM 731) TaxID=1858805 RepID=M5GA59_DACPD|nr:chromatin assembly factor 1 subunit C [Dacryopinax primogenitus]EJU02832.1 chromatin assembly factor 1 subunit C [Dacryopinax primogenitus]
MSARDTPNSSKSGGQARMEVEDDEEPHRPDVSLAGVAWDEPEQEDEHKLINEEYKVWKKNTPFLYDALVTHALDWPSLTCQWFPDKENPPNKPYTVQRLLLGTHSSNQAREYLQIVEVQFPKVLENGKSVLDSTDYDDEKGELGAHGSREARIRVTQKINHRHEVNRARYMPQNPDIIATQTTMGDIYIFDRTKHSNHPDADGECRPDIVLRGQTRESYGMSWNPLKKGHILSASYDTGVYEWDLQQYSKMSGNIESVRKYEAHSEQVEDVSWNRHNDYLFASVGDDKMLYIWDSRAPNKPIQDCVAHDQDVNAVDFNPASETLLLTGSADCSLALWDLRNIKTKLHSFEGHRGSVILAAWSPNYETVFASVGDDRRVNIWDVARIGEEQTPDDAEDGPPELVFMHGGHTSKISDFGWSPTTPWQLCSTADDNILQLWTPTSNVWAGEAVPIEIDELE